MCSIVRSIRVRVTTIYTNIDLNISTFLTLVPSYLIRQIDNQPDYFVPSTWIHLKQGVQRMMVLVVNFFFEFLNYLFSLLLYST